MNTKFVYVFIRDLEEKILKYKKEYPVISILGPRQSGKTTLVKKIFSDYKYISLENLDYREKAEMDPRGFLESFGERLILDEVQRVPGIFSYLQEIVDNNDNAAQYILTGSQEFLLSSQIAQSLAGRVINLHLYPLSLNELLRKRTVELENLVEIIIMGLYPRVHAKKLDFQQWYQNYIETYLEKDIRLLTNIKDLSAFERFLKILASYSGQVINYTNIANIIGVASSTIKTWVSLLEICGIIFFLNPYYKNFNKRITKSPKLYFIDTGLLCSLLSLDTKESLYNNRLYGSIFETFVISEIYKKLRHHAFKENMYYWQNKEKQEVDLVLEHNAVVIFEIKASKTYNSSFAKNLEKWLEISDIENKKAIVIYDGNDLFNGRIKVVPAKKILNTNIDEFFEIFR